MFYFFNFPCYEIVKMQTVLVHLDAEDLYFTDRHWLGADIFSVQ